MTAACAHEDWDELPEMSMAYVRQDRCKDCGAMRVWHHWDDCRLCWEGTGHTWGPPRAR